MIFPTGVLIYWDFGGAPSLLFVIIQGVEIDTYDRNWKQKKPWFCQPRSDETSIFPHVFFCFFSRLVAFWRVRPNSLGAFCLNLAGGTVKGWNWMEITLLIPRSICNKSYGFVMYMCIAVQVLLLLPMVAWILHQHACPCCSDVTSHTAPGVLVECSDVYSVCCCKTERRLDRWDLRCMFKIITWNSGVEVFSPSCTLFQLLDFE